MDKYCSKCGHLITDKNSSEEHIIPNAIGGILVDDGIYCKDCNNSYGKNEDKKFTDIFAPIMAGLKMRFARKSKGSPYTGCGFDSDGNLYNLTYKDNRIVKVIDNNNQHLPPDSKEITGLYLDFKLLNTDFKQGFAKIAFNYAIHCGISAEKMEMLFDDNNHEIVQKPYVFPFIPLTYFDTLIENIEDLDLYHALRIFNIKNYLFAYIELFSTFQNYVLLSECYNDDDIDCSYGNIIEKRDENLDKNIFIPYSHKDASIILQQYNIDYDECVQKLKDKNGGSVTLSDIFNEIGRIAYEKCRTKSYEKPYAELVNNKYYALDIQKLADAIRDDTKFLCGFYDSFRFYTIYEDDKVDINKYKKFLPDGQSYPHAIMEICAKNPKSMAAYGHQKFANLERHSKA